MGKYIYARATSAMHAGVLCAVSIPRSIVVSDDFSVSISTLPSIYLRHFIQKLSICIMARPGHTMKLEENCRHTERERVHISVTHKLSNAFENITDFIGVELTC